MKMNVIGLAVASSLALSACGGGAGSDGPAEPITPPGAGSTPRTKVVFETTDADGDGYTIPLPNDLLFSGSTDLTLNIPGVTDTDLGSSDGTKRVSAALSRLDGWSATAPWVILFSNGDAAVTLDAATLVAGQTVRLYKVKLNRTPLPNGIVPPSGTLTSIDSELVAGTDYRIEVAKEDSRGRTMRVFPLKPLAPQASYMLAVTKGVKDSKGNAVIPDAAYGVAKQTTPLPPTNPAAALQAQVNAQENALVAAGLARDDIALTQVFTVQSVNEVLATVRAFINSPAVPVSSGFQLVAPQNLLPPPASLAPGAANTLIYAGQVKLPYFLKASNAAQDPAAITSFWKSSGKLPDGSPSPLGDSLTYTTKLPVKTGDETVPALLSVPSPALTQCAKPYPVVIFQHGTPRNRLDMFGVSATLANQCFATIAIDLPMHGNVDAANPLHVGTSTSDANGPLRERTFGLDLMNNTTGALLSPDGVPDPTGAWHINLISLLSARDYMRQGVADLFTLTKTIPTVDYNADGTPDLDANKIYFMGISMGSIVGSSFVAYEDKVKAAVLSVPGGGVAKLLDGSKSFGPRIRAGLAGAGIVAGTPNYEKFLFSVQSIVDSGDPINTASVSAARKVPVLVHEVVGGFNNSPSDLAVPNAVVAGTSPNPVTGGTNYTVFSDGPLAGTEPLVRALGLANVSATTGPNPNGIRGVVRFIAGAHASLLGPDANLDPAGTVTAEMQTQAVSFLKTGGALVQVVNGNVVKP